MNVRTRKLTDIVTFLSGFAFPSSQFNTDEEGLPVARIRDVIRGYSETYFDGDFDKKYVLKNGDFIIGMDGEFNIAPWHGGSALLNQRVCKIEHIDEKELDLGYLVRFLALELKRIEDVTPFVTVKHLSMKQLSAVDVPIPPLDEQRRIAAILDQADALRQKRRRTLARLDDLLQSVFLEMFGDPVTNPRRWDVVKLGDLTSHVSSGSTPKGGSSVYVNEGHLFIRSQNVLMFDFDFSDAAFITDDTHNNMKRTWVKNNDVLLNITGASIGRVNYYQGKDDEANVNQHVCIIRPKQERITSVFLTYHLGNRSYQNKILGQNKGATRQAFNFTQIRDFDIVLPPLDIQHKYSKAIDEITRIRQKNEESSIKLNALFGSLQARAFRGELAL